jgi:hypothetical protein
MSELPLPFLLAEGRALVFPVRRGVPDSCSRPACGRFFTNGKVYYKVHFLIQPVPKRIGTTSDVSRSFSR